MEKKTMPVSLFDMVLDHVPEIFIRRLFEIAPMVYEEAWERSYSDPAWDNPEARSIHPLHRRVLLESQLRRIGKDVGLDAAVQFHHGRNCEYGVVKAGPFFVTISAVETEKVFPRHAVSREQNSRVNFMLDQMTFPSMIPDSADDEMPPIYGIITHGPDGSDLKKPGFLNFGIPRPSGRSWAELYSFTKLLAGYNTRKNAADGMETIPDRAAPSVRRKRESGG